MGGNRSTGRGDGFFRRRADGGLDGGCDVRAGRFGSDDEGVAWKNWRIRRAGEGAGGRLRDRESRDESWWAGDVVARSGRDNVSGADVCRILGASDAMGADGATMPSNIVRRIVVHARFTAGDCRRDCEPIRRCGFAIYGRVCGFAAGCGGNRGRVGTARQNGAAEFVLSANGEMAAIGKVAAKKSAEKPLRTG